MLLNELIRFSTQNRTWYCYLILSIWIFLLIAGMYKYIGNTNKLFNMSNMNSKRIFLSTTLDEENSKYNNYKQHCTPIENISRKEDGGVLDGWKLQGVLVVVRHGDRGPMSHVKDINSIDCGVEADVLTKRYKQFLTNKSNQSGANHMLWNKVGPFHGFSLLPSNLKSCFLGQLTYKGISQLLRIGEIMQQVYSHPLGLFLKSSSSKPDINPTPYKILNSDEVIVYTTRYRRTFQSALALMFGFLPHDKWLALNLHESHSMAFCFTDCICPKADVLKKRLLFLAQENLTQHTGVAVVVKWIAQYLLQHASVSASTSHEVMDAVLTLICHNAPLPCKKTSTDKLLALSQKTITDAPTTIDQVDIINIDQDDIPVNSNNQPINFAGIDESALIANMDYNEVNTQTENECLEQNHIEALMSYTNRQSDFLARHVYYKHIGLLRAYGMIRHCVGYMLKMISGDRTKFVLYSGHDWTMQYLTAALGISRDTAFIPYAARLAFEVYRSNTQIDFYFRVIYNGKDVTKQIEFCEGGKSLRITRDSRHKADLCPIENIIRFIHDDYFSLLNATNFKDACTNL